MKKILFSILIMSAMLFTGCFSTEKEENINQESDVIGAILEVAYSKSVKTTAAEVPNASNGVKSGVYLKVGGKFYWYSFVNIAALDNSGKTEFLNKWNNSTMTDGYLVFENKAVTIQVANNAMIGKQSLSIEVANGSNTNTISISSETAVEAYPSTAGIENRTADGDFYITARYESSNWNWVDVNGANGTASYTPRTVSVTDIINMYPRFSTGALAATPKENSIKLGYRKKGETGWKIANINVVKTGDWGDWKEYKLSYSFASLGLTTAIYDITVMACVSENPVIYYQITGQNTNDKVARYIEISVN